MQNCTSNPSGHEDIAQMIFALCSQMWNKEGLITLPLWWRGGLMVSALDSGASAPGSSPGLGHCVVFLGKTLYSHGASLHPGV